MSIEQMSLVLNHSTAKGTAKVVLLGIANHDGDGGAWPSIATLARYANATPRSVQRAIEQLVDAGELVVYVNAGGTHHTPNDRRPNRYEIHVNPVENASHGVTPVSPRARNGVTLVTQRGDAGDAHGVTPVSPEPSLNHPEPAAAGSGVSERIEALADGFAAVESLDSISFTMRSSHRDTVAALVDKHGVPRLVRAAAATKTGTVRRASAFIETWSSLRSSKAAERPDVPRCAVCGRSQSVCEAINARLLPEDRCHA